MKLLAFILCYLVVAFLFGYGVGGGAKLAGPEENNPDQTEE